jgi:DNA-nicking Smr family endonuclease
MPKPRKSAPPPPPLLPFRIGAQAPSLPRGTAAFPPAPLRMDAKAFGRLTRGRLAPDARIDLHGMTLAQAQPELSRFISRAHGSGARLVLVITGKGRLGDDDGPIPRRIGALRHEVPLWLSRPPLGAMVLQVAPAHQRHGGMGAYYVYLSRSK